MTKTQPETPTARRLVADARGLSTVEYVVVLVLIAAVALATWRVFGQRIESLIGLATRDLEALQTAVDGEPSFDDGVVRAPPPASSSPGGPTPPSSPPPAAPRARAALAATLVQASGGATAADRQAVIAQVARLPMASLQALKDNGTKITVVDKSVTQALPHLAGTKPRGWPKGSVWNTTPGLYDPTTNQVVIVVSGGVVPPKGSGHGSENLVIHETGHALQAAAEKPYLSEGGKLRRPPDKGTMDPAFLNARNADLAGLPKYQQQPGKAGREETYAESLALYYENPTLSQKTQPNLHKYWDTHTPGK